MKTLEKQNFAKLVLNIYSNFLRSYHYDSFYDIRKFKDIEDNKIEVSFYLYFRRSGSDFRYTDKFEDLHKYYMSANSLVLLVKYVPGIDRNNDSYIIDIVKDQYDFLLWDNVLMIEQYKEMYKELTN